MSEESESWPSSPSDGRCITWSFSSSSCLGPSAAILLQSWDTWLGRWREASRLFWLLRRSLLLLNIYGWKER